LSSKSPMISTVSGEKSVEAATRGEIVAVSQLTCLSGEMGMPGEMEAVVRKSAANDPLECISQISKMSTPD